MNSILDLFTYKGLKQSGGRVGVLTQYSGSTLELVPQNTNAVAVNYSSKVMGNFEGVLDAYQVPLVANTPRPVFLVLAAMQCKCVWSVKTKHLQRALKERIDISTKSNVETPLTIQ